MQNGFNKLKLGVVPVKRGTGFTSIENALISKNNAFAALGRIDHPVELVTIDDIVPDGIATSVEQVQDIVAHLQSQGVDAVFMLHTDFGSEEVIAKIAKALNRPVLLWGARDDSPSPQGVRIRDTQCGIFASSKVLQRFGVPFTYIENCRATDPAFSNGIIP